MIKVSVIIPVYNAQANVEECVQSICRQTLQDIEILCVDDGSTDRSLEILKRMERGDPRITVIEQTNKGAGAARNAGLAHAKGRYLSFLDADDFFEPRMLETAYHKAEEDLAEIVVYHCDFYDEQHGLFYPCGYSIRQNLLPPNRPFSALEIKKDIFKAIVGWAWDKLFSAEYVRKRGLRFQEQRTSNDLCFVFSAFAGARRISTVTEVLAHQRRHAGGTLSVTREESWGCFYEALTALRRQLTQSGLYERFALDYVNYALHFSLWNLNTLKGKSQQKLYQKLRESWFSELGIAQYPPEMFYHRGEYAQYKSIMRRPYNRFSRAAAKLYQRGKTCLVHGLENLRLR